MSAFRRNLVAAAGLTILLVSIGEAGNNPLLFPGDSILSIDADPFDSASASPDQETAAQAGDGASSTKYLNFGKLNTGFIVQPFIGATTIQSMLLTTANDAEERDPTSWAIFGTNDAICSVDHGTGDCENWTLIAEGDVDLPAARETQHTPISFANSTPYTAYRVLFPDVKNADAANSMQIAEVGLYESTDATGSSVWDDFDFPIAFQLPSPTGVYNAFESPANLLDGTMGTGISESASPGNEEADKIADGTVQKYLNFGKENSGFNIEPAVGPTIVRSFKFFTANDFPGRDPASYKLFGTNDAVTSPPHSLGDQESWTLISEGPLDFPPERDSFTPVTSFPNSTPYTAYQMVFPTLKDTNGAGVDSMQIGEAFFFEDTVGAGFNDILAPGDLAIPIDLDEINGLQTKFLNFGGANGGFIVTPQGGPSIVDSFEIGTANDFPGRDPATYEIYGTNDPISSVDTERGDGENWTLIDSGTFNDQQVPTDRLTVGDVVTINNTTEYTSYRVVFTSLRNPDEEGAGDNLQLSHFEFFGTFTQDPGRTTGDDLLVVMRTDPSGIAQWQTRYGPQLPASAVAARVPEPGTALFVVMGTCAVAVTGRGRRRLSIER